MCLSSRCGGLVGLDAVGRSAAQDRVQDVDAATGGGDGGSVMGLALVALASIVRVTGGVAADGDEGGLVEDAFEGRVALGGALQVADLLGVFEYGCGAGGGELAGGGKPGAAVCLGEELRGECGPHPWQAGDEGRVRVAFERLGDALVDALEPVLAGQCLAGEVADDVGGDGLAGHGDLLGVRGGQRLVDDCGDTVDLHAADPTQASRQPGASRAADLRRSDVAGDEPHPGFGGDVQAVLEARVDAGEQVAQPAKPAGPVGDQFAAATDQQPQLDVDSVGLGDWPQVIAGADLVGDDTGVFGVALAFPTQGGAAGAVDRQSGHVHQPQTGVQDHRLNQPGDPAEHIRRHRRSPARGLGRLNLADQRLDRLRGVGHAAAGELLARRGSQEHRPVQLLGHIDAYRQWHTAPSSSAIPARHPSTVHALHSDRSQCLISGQTKAAGPGAKPPEPSRAASMQIIPAPPACPNPSR